VGYVAHGYRHDPVADGGRYRDVPARAPRTNVAFRFLATGSKEVLIARDQYQHPLFSPVAFCLGRAPRYSQLRR